ALGARELEAAQRRGARTDALVRAAVVEAREHARGLLERRDRVRAARRGDLLPTTQPRDRLGDRLWGLVVEELPVDHHDRRVVARRVALDALERDLAVLGRLVVADAELFGQRAEDLVAAHDRAQRVGAHAHRVLAVGPALVLGVERRDRAHLGGRDAERLGAELDPVRAHVP